MARPGSTPEGARERQATMRVVWRHHLLVRWSHWVNAPLLLGLALSGMSIYWASPVFQHRADPRTGIFDPFAGIGVLLCSSVPGMHDYDSPPDWVYDHLSLGPALLAPALRLHWLCAYLFMLNGLVYAVGLVAGGGWRSLLPRPTDIRDAWSMLRYYVGLPFARLARRPWPHPECDAKYNALQRAAYFSVSLTAFLSVVTGWALHKPTQLYWLAALLGGYDTARILHFSLMCVYPLFLVPHLVLVFAGGWDTLRSMIVGWSARGARDTGLIDREPRTAHSGAKE
jgi:thiosulfate reductase cytochrome b subunit